MKSNFEISVEQSYQSFCECTSFTDSITMDFLQSPVPLKTPQGTLLGSDLLLSCYAMEDGSLCYVSEGARGPVSLCTLDSGASSLVCHLNSADYSLPMTLGNLLRMIPMRRILQQQDVLFFHAAQIAVQGRGILFTAPSGTGKTTQAHLWNDHRGAKIICNDRTLVRNGTTYGYPLDGSEPVGSTESYPLGAIVCLAQEPENTVRRMRPGEALAALLPQLVMDTWDTASRILAVNQLSALLPICPVYRLGCTPDEGAVACLETALRKDGVIR